MPLSGYHLLTCALDFLAFYLIIELLRLALLLISNYCLNFLLHRRTDQSIYIDFPSSLSLSLSLSC